MSQPSPSAMANTNDVSSNDVSSNDVSSDDASSNDASSNDASSNDASSNDAISNDASSNDSCMLLALPRELRDIIFFSNLARVEIPSTDDEKGHIIDKQYLQVEGGYVYDFESRKLSCATPSGARTPIDLELMLSCRQIAAEMQGLALKSNTITFSSFAPAAKQRNLDYYKHESQYWWERTFKCLLEQDWINPSRQTDEEWWPVPNFDESVYRIVAEAFPKFEPHLKTIQLMASDPHRSGDRFDDTILSGMDFAGQQVQKLIGRDFYCLWNHWGEVPSLHRQAALETLKLIASRGCWSQNASSDACAAFGGRLGKYQVPTTDRAGDVLRYHSLYKPWTIVEDDAHCDIRADTRHPAHLRSDYMTAEAYTRKYHGHSVKLDEDEKHFLSAAQIAIDFLEGIPVQRKNIRNIVLDEKDPCMRYSECHGLGLIDFCKENPHLRIERRADLWRNVWPIEEVDYGHELLAYNDEGMYLFENGRGYHDELHELSVTEPVARWVVEALALVPAGMPLGSFTLVLDGSSAPEQCTQLFQRVHRDAAWQTALGECLDRGHLPKLAYHDRRRMEAYIYEDFPQALREISTGTCPAVRANFDVGEPWDVEAIIEAHREWTLIDWEDKWDLSNGAWGLFA